VTPDPHHPAGEESSQTGRSEGLEATLRDDLGASQDIIDAGLGAAREIGFEPGDKAPDFGDSPPRDYDDSPENRAKIDRVRDSYNKEITSLSALRDALISRGESKEAIAYVLNAARRTIGKFYKSLTPEPGRTGIYGRNLNKYGDELGPTVQKLRDRRKSWDDIIDSALRTGGGDLGLRSNQ
jgi:sugar phosphate isomerase/epimerase